MITAAEPVVSRKPSFRSLACVPLDSLRMEGRGPVDVTRELVSAWRDADIGALDGLLCDDVSVSGLLADGRPISGKAAVLAMVEDFFASPQRLELVNIEELGPISALLQMRIVGEPPGEDDRDSWWLWGLDAGRLQESHAFTSREAALSWFADQGPSALS